MALPLIAVPPLHARVVGPFDFGDSLRDAGFPEERVIKALADVEEKRRTLRSNERLLSLVGRDEDGSLAFTETDYATSLVARGLWKERYPDGRGECEAWASHSFGIDAVVKTADGKLAYAKRAANMSFYPNALATCVGETMNILDEDNATCTPDPSLTVRRGFTEEMGLEIPVSAIQPLSLALDPAVHHLSMLALVDLTPLGITSADLMHRHAQARDVDEGSLHFVDWNPRAIAAVVNQGEWVPASSVATAQAVERTLAIPDAPVPAAPVEFREPAIAGNRKPNFFELDS